MAKTKPTIRYFKLLFTQIIHPRTITACSEPKSYYLCN